MLNQEWEIKPRAIACKTCQQPFADAQPYVSCLRVAAEGTYERADCCEACWGKSADTAGAFSVWHGTFTAVVPLPEVLKKETAESLLRKLIEKKEPAYRNAIFILTVMLERKRILAEKEVQKQDDSTVLRVYEHRRTGETFVISDPMLGLDQLGQIQAEIVALLSQSEDNANGVPNLHV